MKGENRTISIFKIFLVIAISALLLNSIPALAQEGSTPETVVLREGNDFATLELGNPWDMDDFSDVSQGFNSFGSQQNLYNFQVANGVFSAYTRSSLSPFYALYPGYLPAMHMDKTGYQHPIDSSKYSCFSIASYIEPSASSYQVVNWVLDMTLSQGGYAGGMLVDSGKWQLYSYDLSTHPEQAGMNWNSSDWMGLFLVPTNQTNKYFAIDWIRLTDCTPVYFSVSGLPAGTFSLWLGTGTPERQILVQPSFSPQGGSYQWDAKGVQPGTYTYYVKNAGGGIVQQGSLIIEPAPIPTFINPSPTIGSDYADLAGNPWDMQDQQDVTAVSCANYAILNNILNVDTLPPSGLPSSCVGSGANEADPKIYLNTPSADNITQYRYLSFRHKIDAPWSQPAEGMIVRWIWEMSGLASYPCKYVSREITLDVGWQTYWVDLYDLWNGTPAEVGGLSASSCPKNVHWSTQPGTLSQFRLDPNENILNFTFHQEFDWIRLTKVPSVYQGVDFPIQVSMNKSPTTISAITFYYTNDLNQPTQHLAQGTRKVENQETTNQPTLAGSYQIFIPVVQNRYAPPIELPSVENEILFQWDTSSVAPGEYYTCAVTSDGYNQTTFCSEAPVKILP